MMRGHDGTVLAGECCGKVSARSIMIMTFFAASLQQNVSSFLNSFEFSLIEIMSQVGSFRFHDLRMISAP
jgi:hypothetical protein